MGRAAKKIEWPLAMSILESLEKQDRKRELMMVALGLFTAYRCSDWSKLKWGDITDNIQRKEQKTGKMREVALHPEMKRIAALCKNGNDDTHIFMPLRGGTGKPLATGGAIKILRRIGIEHGIADLSTHSLRKTFGRRVYDQNGQNDHALMMLGLILNHSNTATTRAYLGLTRMEIDDICLNI